MHARRTRHWLEVAVVYAVILGVSSVPGDELAGTPGWLAVVGHATGYALLAGTIHRAVDGRSAALVAVVLAVVLGIVNEVQQSLVPGRSPEAVDVAVDGLGALAGVWLRNARLARRRFSRRRPGSRPPGRGSAARR